MGRADFVTTEFPNNNGHNWVRDPAKGEPQASWVFCSFCLNMRRADGQNKPCKGAPRLRSLDLRIRPTESEIPVEPELTRGIVKTLNEALGPRKLKELNTDAQPE